jgi:hypothetical protein
MIAKPHGRLSHALPSDQIHAESFRFFSGLRIDANFKGEPTRRALVQSGSQRPALGKAEIEEGSVKTVLIYINTSKQVGDVDHLKVFANVDAAETWFEENDPEGVVFEYEVWNESPPIEPWINDLLTTLIQLAEAAFRCSAYQNRRWPGQPAAVFLFGRLSWWPLSLKENPPARTGRLRTVDVRLAIRVGRHRSNLYRNLKRDE